MSIIKEYPEPTIEQPRHYDFHNVMYWEKDSQLLVKQKQSGEKEAATLLTKAREFLFKNCIVKREDHFICKPIEGYNKTTYTIRQIGDGFECNCQGFSNNHYCSHILAVRQFIFLEENNAES